MQRGLGEFLNGQLLDRVRLHSLTFLRDGLVVLGSYVLAEYLRFVPNPIPGEQVSPFAEILPAVVFIFMACLYLFGAHRPIWLYAGSRDARGLVDAVVVASLSVIILDVSLDSLAKPWAAGRPIPISVAFTGGIFSLVALGLVRAWPLIFQRRLKSTESWSRVLIVGAGQGGNLVAADLLANPQWKQLPVGFLDDDLSKRRRRIHNVPVLGTVTDLPRVVQDRDVDIIGVAIPSASTRELDRILKAAQATECRIQVLPTIGEMMIREAPMRLRDINLNDLLDRPPTGGATELEQYGGFVQGKVVMVTGAAGSIGAELCRQIMTLTPRLLVGIDNNETGLFFLERELADAGSRIPRTLILGDITDVAKLERIFADSKPSVIFHAAAYKHVPILEAHPEEAVFVNMQGTMNLCRLAASTGVERFVFISSDKAVHPVNALGFSKRLGELVTRAHGGAGRVFCSVRFGNVIASRGSALPEFIRQIDAGGPVLVTHPDAERYFMTIPEAVSLVIKAGGIARGGETFMLDMGPPIKIDDLAKRIIRMRGLRVGADIEVVYTGLRPGEKLTEELMWAEEKMVATENPSIFSVRDEALADLGRLESWARLITAMANSGNSEAVKASLRDASEGQPVPTLKPVTITG